MPAKSGKQKKLMDAAAHNPSFAKKVGIPVSVAKKFSKESKGKEFGKGGTINRVGDAVTPSRRDPDIGSMIPSTKVTTKKPKGGSFKGDTFRANGTGKKVKG